MGKTAQHRWWLAGIVLILVIGYCAVALIRPLPDIRPTQSSISLSLGRRSSSLAWPNVGQAAVGIVGSEILNTHNDQKPVPTASTAKLITALMILKQKPLSLGQQGPIVTLSAADVAIYTNYLAQNGSVVQVQAGEQISEYQMLEAMLLPSANNMADSLAIWAYGSLPAYSAAANSYAKQIGLTGTTIGSDASGFAPTTLSTAHDLVIIGELVMQNPVLSGIVGQASASGLPLAGNIKNVNSLLGTSGIIGVKTGNTDQAGGVFVAAAKVNINQKPVTLVTALMGAPDLSDALNSSLPLVQSAESNFSPVTTIKAGTAIGYYRSPWSDNVPAIAKTALGLYSWNGSHISVNLKLPVIKSTSKSGQLLTKLNVPNSAISNQKEINIVLGSTPKKPSLYWRLAHP